MRAEKTKPLQSSIRNRLLAGLEASDFEQIAKDLIPVTLSRSTELAFPDAPIENVYFIEDGVVSIIVVSAEGRNIEAGLVGYEGLTPTAEILGAPTTADQIVVQIAGAAWRLPAAALAAAMERSPPFRRLLTLFVETLIVQTRQTARANAMNSIEERLARWLLMCADRVRGPHLNLTQEYLAIMLGVRRASVSEAIAALETRGLLQAKRGLLVLTDRHGLERLAGDTYGRPEETYERLIGRHLKRDWKGDAPSSALLAGRASS